jgi:hypothetical protein
MQVPLRNNSIACAQASNGWRFKERKQRGQLRTFHFLRALTSRQHQTSKQLIVQMYATAPLQIFAAWRLSVKKNPGFNGLSRTDAYINATPPVIAPVATSARSDFS